MKDAKNFDGVGANPVRDDEGRTGDYEFPRSLQTSRSAAVGETHQSIDRRQNESRLALGGFWFVLSDIDLQRVEVAQRTSGPFQSHWGRGRSSSDPHDRTHATTAS